MSIVRLMILGAACLGFVSTSFLQAGEKKSPGDAARLEAVRVKLHYDFADAKQFAAWKTGPTDTDKIGKYDYGNRPVTWALLDDKGLVRGNGGYLLLPQRLSAHHPITVDFLAGYDNGNIHCGLFTGEPRFMAKNGGFYFNAGGCSNDFTSIAQNGKWVGRKQLPFQKGLYPIRLTFTPDLKTKTVALTYSVNGERYFEISRPLPEDHAKGLRFAFLSGWVGGGYSVERVTISATPFEAIAPADALSKANAK